MAFLQAIYLQHNNWKRDSLYDKHFKFNKHRVWGKTQEIFQIEEYCCVAIKNACIIDKLWTTSTFDH